MRTAMTLQMPASHWPAEPAFNWLLCLCGVVRVFELTLRCVAMSVEIKLKRSDRVYREGV
jgi:hypothetical protein